MTWVQGFKRVFNSDIQRCCESSDTVNFTASIEDVAVINQKLVHLPPSNTGIRAESGARRPFSASRPFDHR